MRLTVKQFKEILTDFGVFKSGGFVSEIMQHTSGDFEWFSCKYDQKEWGVAISANLVDEPDFLKAIFPWPTTEIRLIPNPTLKNSFTVPFHQKQSSLVEHINLDTRLDTYLANSHPDFSRNQIQKLIKANQVSVNEKIVTTPKTIIDAAKHVVKIIPQKKAKKTKLDFTILYEDENLMAIDKPSGILTHAIDPQNDHEFTAADFAAQYGNFESKDHRNGIVHRLDRLTSGVLILAKNQQATNFLKQQFQDRKVEKTYLAVVGRQPKHSKAKIDLPIKRSLKQNGTFAVDPNGKSAITFYETISAKPPYYLLKLNPITGRTHQLRVHLSHIASPIIGDKLYQGPKHSRLMLHASSIKFTTPDGQELTITAKTPPEFAQ